MDAKKADSKKKPGFCLFAELLASCLFRFASSSFVFFANGNQSFHCQEAIILLAILILKRNLVVFPSIENMAANGHNISFPQLQVVRGHLGLGNSRPTGNMNTTMNSNNTTTTNALNNCGNNNNNNNNNNMDNFNTDTATQRHTINAAAFRNVTNAQARGMNQKHK